MKPVTFVRTSPTALGEMPADDRALCAECGSSVSGGAGALSGYVNPLSLDALLIRHPGSTYFVEVGTRAEESISENQYLGVRTGDVLTIDRARTPSVGCLVLVICEGEFALCRYIEHEGGRFLVCGERTKEPVALGEEVQVWGVVSALSRQL